MSVQSDTLVTCREVCFSYTPHTLALNDISFEIQCGDLLYIVGQSGSGKSTLAHLIAGLLTPTAGTLAVRDGIDPAFVLQFPEALFLFDTIGQELGSLKSADRRACAHEFIADFGISGESLSEISPHRLSFAQRRVLAVSLLCAKSRELILLDEPTLGLDEQNMRAFANWLTSIARKGNSCAVITHDLELIASTPGEVLILHEGQIAWKGRSEEFIESEDLLRTAAAL